MKYFLTSFSIVFFTINIFGQDCDEFRTHYESIDCTFFPGHYLDRFDTIYNSNKAFVDYTIEKLLAKPSDECFISNRNIMNKLELKYCDTSKLVIQGKLKNNKTCKISLTVGKFYSSDHSIKKSSSTTLKLIDGQYPYGGNGIIEKEIKNIQITVGNKILKIPQYAFGNFYEPNICDSHGFERQIEAYESLNGQYIYLYIYGGNAADTYFAKLIFDHAEFITKIVSDYFPLSIFGSFREDFIGF